MKRKQRIQKTFPLAASFAARLDTGQLESKLRLYLNDSSLNLAEYHVAVRCGYPIGAVYTQSVYATMVGQGSMTSKTVVPKDVIKEL